MKQTLMTNIELDRLSQEQLFTYYYGYWTNYVEVESKMYGYRFAKPLSIVVFTSQATGPAYGVKTDWIDSVDKARTIEIADLNVYSINLDKVSVIKATEIVNEISLHTHVVAVFNYNKDTDTFIPPGLEQVKEINRFTDISWAYHYAAEDNQIPPIMPPAEGCDLTNSNILKAYAMCIQHDCRTGL